MKVKRVNLSGKTTISFDTESSKWLIKNFSDGDITVSFDANAKAEESILIPSGMGQVVISNEMAVDQFYSSDTIYITGTGTVEVQQLCYR